MPYRYRGSQEASSGYRPSGGSSNLALSVPSAPRIDRDRRGTLRVAWSPPGSQGSSAVGSSAVRMCETEAAEPRGCEVSAVAADQKLEHVFEHLIFGEVHSTSVKAISLTGDGEWSGWTPSPRVRSHVWAEPSSNASELRVRWSCADRDYNSTFLYHVNGKDIYSFLVSYTSDPSGNVGWSEPVHFSIPRHAVNSSQQVGGVVSNVSTGTYRVRVRPLTGTARNSTPAADWSRCIDRLTVIERPAPSRLRPRMPAISGSLPCGRTRRSPTERPRPGWNCR